jgi:hypothetical protein
MHVKEVGLPDDRPGGSGGTGTTHPVGAAEGSSGL